MATPAAGTSTPQGTTQTGTGQPVQQQPPIPNMQPGGTYHYYDQASGRMLTLQYIAGHTYVLDSSMNIAYEYGTGALPETYGTSRYGGEVHTGGAAQNTLTNPKTGGFLWQGQPGGQQYKYYVEPQSGSVIETFHGGHLSPSSEVFYYNAAGQQIGYQRPYANIIVEGKPYFGVGPDWYPASTIKGEIHLGTVEQQGPSLRQIEEMKQTEKTSTQLVNAWLGTKTITPPLQGKITSGQFIAEMAPKQSEVKYLFDPAYFQQQAELLRGQSRMVYPGAVLGAATTIYPYQSVLYEKPISLASIFPIDIKEGHLQVGFSSEYAAELMIGIPVGFVLSPYYMVQLGYNLLTDPIGTIKSQMEFVTTGKFLEMRPFEVGKLIGSVAFGEYAGGKLNEYIASRSITEAYSPRTTAIVFKEMPTESGTQFSSVIEGTVQTRTYINILGKQITIGKGEMAISATQVAEVYPEPVEGLWNVKANTIGTVGTQTFLEKAGASGMTFEQIKFVSQEGISPYSITFGKQVPTPNILVESGSLTAIYPQGGYEFNPAVYIPAGQKLSGTFSYSVMGSNLEASVGVLREESRFMTPIAEVRQYSHLYEASSRTIGLTNLNVLDWTVKGGDFEGITSYGGKTLQSFAQMQKIIPIGGEVIKESVAASLQATANSIRAGDLSAVAYNLLGIVPSQSKTITPSKTENRSLTTPVQSSTSVISRQFSPQAFVEKQIEKIVSLDRILPVSMIKSRESARTLDLTRTMDLTRTSDLTRTVGITRTIDITKNIGATATASITKSIDITRTIDITKNNPPSLSVVRTPPPPPTIPWIGTGIDHDFMKQLRKHKSVETKKITKYTPSAAAVGFNIRKVVNMKALQTGLNIRPIPLPKGRKR